MEEKRYSVIFILFLIGIVFSSSSIFGQADKKVTIAFDEKSLRIDLLTGEKLPNYSQVQQGSLQFFLDRLDTPDRSITFYHDGIQNVSIDNLSRIEKVQSQFSIWRLIYKRGTKNTPRIHHKAVSFIPLNAKGEVQKRVYVLLDDLKLIDWGE